MSDSGVSTEKTDEFTEEEDYDMECVTQRRCENYQLRKG